MTEGEQAEQQSGPEQMTQRENTPWNSFLEAQRALTTHSQETVQYLEQLVGPLAEQFPLLDTPMFRFIRELNGQPALVHIRIFNDSVVLWVDTAETDPDYEQGIMGRAIITSENLAQIGSWHQDMYGSKLYGGKEPSPVKLRPAEEEDFSVSIYPHGAPTEIRVASNSRGGSRAKAIPPNSYGRVGGNISFQLHTNEEFQQDPVAGVSRILALLKSGSQTPDEVYAPVKKYSTEGTWEPTNQYLASQARQG